MHTWEEFYIEAIEGGATVREAEEYADECTAGSTEGHPWYWV